MHSVVLKDAGLGDFETICGLKLAEVRIHGPAHGSLMLKTQN